MDWTKGIGPSQSSSLSLAKLAGVTLVIEPSNSITFADSVDLHSSSKSVMGLY